MRKEMRFKAITYILLVALAAISCDEGKIYSSTATGDPEGGRARLEAKVRGADQWPEGYTLALAGFAEGNDYSLASKNVTPGPEGECNVILTGIPEEVSSVELCVIDRLRRRVATYASEPFSGANCNLEMLGVEADVSPAAAIQRDIFNTTCVNCHGASATPAAGLDLTEGHSFVQLVNTVSHKSPGTLRVAPGSSAESLLWHILTSGESSGWHYDHQSEVVDVVKLNLLRDWIDSGAKY